jgi:50S ribosomal subunit-associated GTPase HflX
MQAQQELADLNTKSDVQVVQDLIKAEKKNTKPTSLIGTNKIEKIRNTKSLMDNLRRNNSEEY